MKRSVTRQSAYVLAGFIAIIALSGVVSAQDTSMPQTAQRTQNLAIPGPLMDAWNYVTDLGNQLITKLPKYSLINEKNAGETIQQGVKSFNYNSLNDLFGGIATWFNNNVNLANMPGFINDAAAVLRQLVEMVAQALKMVVGYL